MIDLKQPEIVTDLTGGLIISAIPIPDNVDVIRFSLDGLALSDPELFVKLTIDFSPDFGKTWASLNPGPDVNPFPVEVMFQGGSTDRSSLSNIANKVPLPEYFWESPIIPPGKSRMIKGHLDIIGSKLTTTVSIKGFSTGGVRVK